MKKSDNSKTKNCSAKKTSGCSSSKSTKDCK